MDIACDTGAKRTAADQLEVKTIIAAAARSLLSILEPATSNITIPRIEKVLHAFQMEFDMASHKRQGRGYCSRVRAGVVSAIVAHPDQAEEISEQSRLFANEDQQQWASTYALNMQIKKHQGMELRELVCRAFHAFSPENKHRKRIRLYDFDKRYAHIRQILMIAYTARTGETL